MRSRGRRQVNAQSHEWVTTPRAELGQTAQKITKTEGFNNSVARNSP
jgi:hypothetical protein